MAWTAPATATVGQVLTASFWNQQVRDNMKELWRELAYVEFTAPVSITSTNEAAPTDIVSTGSITVAGVPILIEFYCPSLAETTSTTVNLWEGSTNLGRICVAGASGEAQGQRRRTPTAGSKTYKASGWETSGSGTATAGAGGAAAYVPGFIRVWERGG